MGRYLINEDDADEIMDYLITLDDSYAEYLAEKIFIISNYIEKDFEVYASRILEKKVEKEDKTP